ncbi:RING/U-box superfamily protein [Hibiscus syriacus]|uniref:RING-type E3 ubiquitin transferase n=1 Tax=Hibiscus syriacus TaxID=106335 RepID=A0A6A2WJK4_HIBSY|nr:RING/U-box superfamily protein [Hibiscus syriacus]
MTENYWCYQCSQVVTPIVAIEIKCPFCQGGFIEQMSGYTTRDDEDMDSDMGSDRARSLWAPILLGSTDLNREFDSIIQRRRSSATILQLLQGIRDGMASEVENSENDG